MARTILIVDDDASVRSLARAALEKEGYEVVTVEDGLHALSWLATHTPDLILTDFVMPRMNGWMLIRALDAKNLAKDTPVVVMSTLTDKVGDRLVEMTRVDECIRKPFRAPELVDVVRRHVGRTPRSDLPDTGEADDTWIVVANVQELLQDAVAGAITARIDELVEADSRTRVLAIISDILDGLVDERFAADLVALARDKPTH